MPGTAAVAFNDLAALEQALHKKDVAAFIVEPVQGKSCEVMAYGYWPKHKDSAAEPEPYWLLTRYSADWGAQENGLLISAGPK